ncbi:MAG TPA: hypothetical protein VLC09_06575, partial [Polyangiaceae bacterium]|nr:hypothetical protein [Polyangiaceae bacterium]
MLGVRRKFVGAGLYVLSTAGVLAGGGCSGDAGKDDADRDGATGGTSSDDDRAPSGGMGGDDNGWDGSDLSLGGSGGSGTGGAGTGGSGTGGGKDDGCSVVAAAVKTHVDAMATNGWAHLNAQAELAMYGCVGSEATRDCLSEKTDAASTVYGADWTDDSPGTTIRVLRTNTAAS